MILAVIPARYASTRFPGKPLIDLGGKTMIQRVYEQVIAATCVNLAIVATDDIRIAETVQAFGGQVIMTRPDHPSGTDRCAEVALQYPEANIVLNIQGDEPFIFPQQIDLLANTLLQHPEADIATLIKKIELSETLFSPNTVKAVINTHGAALYFSRHPIPFYRGKEPAEWLQHHNYYKHLGLYGFRRSVLLELATLPTSPLESCESLEQLRWLENGRSIQTGITEQESMGIDTPADLDKARLYLHNRQ
jgi:3-deoxy-manno-octulosonate cytidylyltransferase (CMP-KDO synthetase)